MISPLNSRMGTGFDTLSITGICLGVIAAASGKTQRFANGTSRGVAPIHS